ncbi:MAG: alkaline phosphatase, partial [Alphaproteobacteria bacterium]
TAGILGQQFNSDNDTANSGDKRSDNKGPEPEGVAVGEIAGRTYAFIGLERVGGIMIYDVSDPEQPQFVDYRIDRNFSTTLDYELPGDFARAGDLGPEGLVFVPAGDSVLGAPLLIVANEVSGSLTVYKVITRP